MPRSSRLLAHVVVLIVLASSAAALGDPVAPEQRNIEASAHFDRGTIFYTEGDYAAALIEFKRAYDLSPSWQVLFNIGQSYFQLHDYPNALLTLERFASEGGGRIGADDQATLDKELPDLASRVGTVTIVSNLDGATLTVDDRAIGTTPLGAPVLIGMGLRRIGATYEGRAPVEQRVAVGGGDTLALRLDFAPARPAQPANPRTTADHRFVRPPVNYVPTYLAFLVAAGGVAVGSIFGVVAIGDKSNLDGVCVSDGACPPSSQAGIRSLVRDSLVSTIGFGVAASGLAVATALWLTATSSSSTPASSLRFGPGLLAGSF